MYGCAGVCMGVCFLLVYVAAVVYCKSNFLCHPKHFYLKNEFYFFF